MKEPQPLSSNISKALCHYIEHTLKDYFEQHQEHLPGNLYELVINAAELPLLKLVLKQTQYNQSHAAKMLGINRATLSKKMRLYGLADHSIEKSF